MTSQPHNTLNRGGFLALAGTVAGVTGITLSNNFATSGNPAWPAGLPPAAYRQAVAKADSTLDPAQQKAALRAMVDTFVTEAWNIPIGYRTNLFALKPNVRGLGWGVYSQPRFANVSLS